MSIKSILVHLAMDDDCSTRLKSAVEAAKALDAHLICLYVAYPVHMPAGAEGRGASAVYLAEATKKARSIGDEIKELAELSCKKAGISWEWVYGEEDHLDRILEHLHRTDLTILTQVNLDSFEDRLMYQTPEIVIQEAGGPVLILPRVGADTEFGRPDHLLINWSYSKESMRAVRDAMPIIERAGKVTLLFAGHADNKVKKPDFILHYLRLHGIEAELVIEPESRNPGESILETARELGADRIVMGAYASVGIRNRLFGGITRHVIGNTTIPLILSH